MACPASTSRSTAEVFISFIGNHAHLSFKNQFSQLEPAFGFQSKNSPTVSKTFDFAAFNLQTAEKAKLENPIAVAQDASFIKKSGKLTFGLAKFWNSADSHSEKGLEVSLIALIEMAKTLHSLFLTNKRLPFYRPQKIINLRRELIFISRICEALASFCPNRCATASLMVFMPKKNLCEAFWI